MQKRVIAGMGMIQWNLTISIKIIYCKEIEIRKWQLGLPAPRSSVEELLKCYYSTPWQGHSSEGCCLSVGSINKDKLIWKNRRVVLCHIKSRMFWHTIAQSGSRPMSEAGSATLFLSAAWKSIITWSNQQYESKHRTCIGLMIQNLRNLKGTEVKQ